LEDVCVDWRILKWILTEQNGRVWSRLFWLKFTALVNIIRQLRGSWKAAEEMFASEEGLCSMELAAQSNCTLLSSFPKDIWWSQTCFNNCLSQLHKTA
jgi:hypothetical protein